MCELVQEEGVMNINKDSSSHPSNTYSIYHCTCVVTFGFFGLILNVKEEKLILKKKENKDIKSINGVKTLISTQAGLFYPVVAKGHNASAPCYTS